MNKQEKKEIIVFLILFIIISSIGYIFKINFLIPLIIRKNGFVLGFSSLIISFILTALINLIIKNRKN